MFAASVPNSNRAAYRLARLAQNEELRRAGREAGSGRGLEQMTRRKRETVGLTNERDFPHLVELAFAPGGFRSVFLEIDAFHRERRIPARRGRSRHEAEQLYIRFCRSEEHTSELQSLRHLVCRLL